MKMKFLFSVILLCLYSYISAQNTESLHKITYPNIAIKSNLLYDATTTINLGAEFGLGKKTTFEIPINLNAWDMSDNKKFKHWMVQPEFRFWSCEVFNGFFWGMHGHAGQFNVGGLKLPFGAFPTLEDHRYEGYFYGAGLGLGYQWILGNRWNLELGIGAGYTRFEYDKYKCQQCGEKLKEGGRNYIGPDRVALSLIYIIR